MLIQVKINSTDVSSAVVNMQYERTYGDLTNEITLDFAYTLNLLVTPTPGMTLEVWRGWAVATEEKIFWGYIEKTEAASGKIVITGVDKSWDLVRKSVNHTYDSIAEAGSFAGKISSIFNDLVVTYAGLSTTYTGGASDTIQDTGTEFVMQKFKCSHVDIMERCQALAQIMNWQFYYRADTDKVYFEPKGNLVNSTILTVGGNVISVPSWKYDITQMCNDLYVVGSTQEVETTKGQVTADSSPPTTTTGKIGTTSGFATTSISLDFTPISVKVYGDASAPPTTLKTGGVQGSTSTYDYYVDQPQMIIYPHTTFANNAYYQVQYTYSRPATVHISNAASIAAYGTFSQTQTFTDIITIQDAESRGINYLNQYSQPFIYSTLKVKNVSTSGLAVGQNIQVVDNVSIPNVNEIVLINKIRIRWPSDFDEIDVGEKYWQMADWQAQILNKIKREQEYELASQEIVNEVLQISNSGMTSRNRYLEILVGPAGSEVRTYLAQENNDYQEMLVDTDFKDAANTTATWGTGLAYPNAKLTFAAGSSHVATSSSIDFGNGTITIATVHYFESGATLEMSADGGLHWETAGQDTPLVFAYPGTDLRWRITVGAAGKIIYAIPDHPAVRVWAYH
jgi:hypothetical protein